MLDPTIIAQTKTLDEINACIAKYSAAVDAAVEMKSYDLSDMQSKQRVESQDLGSLTDLLSAYLEAKAILTQKSHAAMYAGRFTGRL